MPFKYAFNTWTYSSFPVWVPCYPLDEAIRRIARIGYDGIEIGCAAPHAWPAHLGAARRRIAPADAVGGADAGQPAARPGGGPGNDPSSSLPEERAAAIAHYKEVVDLAHDLGAARVLYIAGWRAFGTTQDEAWAWSLEALVAIARHAEESGVQIAVEPTSANSILIVRRRRAEAARAERPAQRQGDVRHLSRPVSLRSQLRLCL